MSAPVQVWDFAGRPVRTAGTFEAPLFCAFDVCAVLGLDNVSQALARLKADDVASIISSDVQGKTRQISYVTEAGLYKLVLRSRKPKAEDFVDWVTGEVLPEIRKRGIYDAVAVAQRRQTELLLVEIFPNAPSKAEPIFRQLISALLRLRREKDGAPNPPWARMLASWIYGWAIPVEGQQQHRRALNVSPNGSRIDHSMLCDEAREQVRRVADIGVCYTRTSPTWEAWRANMELAFGKTPQLPLWVPMLLKPSDSEVA